MLHKVLRKKNQQLTLEDLDELEEAHISPSNDDTFQVSNEDDLVEDKGEHLDHEKVKKTVKKQIK